MVSNDIGLGEKVLMDHVKVLEPALGSKNPNRGELGVPQIVVLLFDQEVAAR